MHGALIFLVSYYSLSPHEYELIQKHDFSTKKKNETMDIFNS